MLLAENSFCKRFYPALIDHFYNWVSGFSEESVKI